MSKPIDDGGPVHPVNFMDFQPTTGEQVVREQHNGISLRDWFAGQALAGFCANSDPQLSNATASAIAKWAYEIADAMLAARKEKP